MKTLPPTQNQINILVIIFNYMNRNEFSPTEKDIAKLASISLTLSKYYVQELVKKGLIERYPQFAARNISITKTGEKALLSL